MLWGLFLLMPDPQAGEPDVGLSPTGELLRYNCSPVCGSPTWGVWDLIILSVRPSYHLVGFLHVFGCINRISFLVGLRLFYWWLVSIQLWLWWASTLPSCPPKYFYVCCISFLFFVCLFVCLFVWNSTSDTRSCVPRQLIILGWKFKTFLMNFLVLNDAFIFLY